MFDEHTREVDYGDKSVTGIYYQAILESCIHQRYLDSINWPVDKLNNV